VDVDSDTRRIVLGIGLLVIGFVISGASGYHLRAIVVAEIGSEVYCASSSCLQTMAVLTIGEIAGGIIAFVGFILALLAVFRKLGKPPGQR
jgi:hypothetical protein